MIYYLKVKNKISKYEVFSINFSEVNLFENFALGDFISAKGLETRAISVEQFFDLIFSGNYRLDLEQYKNSEKGTGIKFEHGSLVVLYNIESERFSAHKKSFIDVVDRFMGSLESSI